MTKSEFQRLVYSRRGAIGLTAVVTICGARVIQVNSLSVLLVVPAAMIVMMFWVLGYVAYQGGQRPGEW